MFEIYGRSNCSWCDAAKALLERKGFSYSYHNIETDPEKLMNFRILFPEAKTVPQIMKGSLYIGGYSDLEKYLA